jgi:hypothetical protein
MNINKDAILQEFEKLGISIKNDDGEYHTLHDVFSEINEKWDSLSVREQNKICFLLTAISCLYGIRK